MTVETLTRLDEFDGNDATTEFTLTFELTVNGDVYVKHVDADDVITELTETTDYTLVDDTLTYPVSGDPLATGERLVAYRDVANTQPYDLTGGDGYFIPDLEAGLDRCILAIQEHEENLARCVSKDIADDTEVPSFTEINDSVDAAAASASDAATSESNAADSEAAAAADAAAVATALTLAELDWVSVHVDTPDDVLTLDASGDAFFSQSLGVGAVAPSGINFYIYAATGSVVQRLMSDDDTAGAMQVQLYNDVSDELSIGKLGSALDVFGVGSGAILNRGGNFNIVSDSNDPIRFLTDVTDSKDLSATEKMRLTAAGVLTIGDGTAPTATGLEILDKGVDQTLIKESGNVAVQCSYDSNRTTADNAISMFIGKWDGNEVARISFRAGTDTGNKDDGYIRFDIAEGGVIAEAMRIGQDGKVKIGTPGNAGHMLEVEGSGATFIEANAGTDSKGGFVISENGTQKWKVFNDDSNDRYTVADADEADGVYLVQDGESGWTNFSDLRIKKDIQIITNALEKIQAIRGFSYSLERDASGRKRRIGVGAQDLIAAGMSEIVDYEMAARKKDVDRGLAVKEGDMIEHEIFGVAYDGISPYLIEAIKELAAKVETLEGV
ncbi:tail fiber domain-containing protein [Candidatus Pacearchaeota archaeon]|nr:tail fiber domain-containing protein [Candidatus Pacearchaeota archaeon]